MEERSKNEVVYYYDSHPTEEDLMGESNPHLDLVTYLVTLLRYLFRDQACAVYGNLNFYQTRNPHEYPLVPDVAVIKGAAYDPFATSWKVGLDGPAPQVVFELLSKGTWERDLTEKPLAYAHMGVQEYFAYDPHKCPLALATAQRLFGWRLSPRDATMRPLSRRQRGYLLSIELDSRLVPDGRWLRLYDRSGHLRLTEAEVAGQRAEAAEQRARLLAEKLRSLGVDPDQP
ncbi:MAG TPA: Uma2 family endonuclease [Ktedonobacteraceae bacterium]|nr:Uma2 family endonuclease [Ktedonobacteraceae bacterium]